MVVHASNPSMWKVEAGVLPDQSQPGLPVETLVSKTKQQKKGNLKSRNMVH
jgi:hypothetical protein